MKIASPAPIRGPGLLILILAILAHGFPSGAAGLRDLQDGWVLSSTEAFLLLNSPETPDGSEEIGADLGEGSGRGWISVGNTRLFGMPDLPVTALAGGGSGALGGKRWVVGFSWERSGGEVFLEDRKDIFLGFGKGTVLGLEYSRSGIWIGNENEARHSGLAGIVAHRRMIWDGTLIQVTWCCDLSGSPPWFGRLGRRDLASVSLLRPDAGLGLGLAVDRRGDGTPGLSLELSIGLADRFGLGVRADPPTGSIGPITMWRTGRLLVRTSHVTHPDLGLTHRVSLTVGR